MITIVIVTFNAARTIKNCIESVITHKPASSHIVVVDNGSTDGTIEIIESFDTVELIKTNKNVGFGEGNNVAMRKYNSEYYYLHNSDAYLTEGAIQETMLAMENDRSIGIAGPTLVYPDGSRQTSSYSFSSPQKWIIQVAHIDKIAKIILKNKLFNFILKPFAKSKIARSYVSIYGSFDVTGSVVEVDWVCGAGMMISRTAYRLTDGFDPQIFLYGEDEDICIRIYNKELRCALVHVSNPIVHEHGWRSNGKRSSYSPLKYGSLKVFIDKHFHGYSNILMHGLLYVKKRLNVD